MGPTQVFCSLYGRVLTVGAAVVAVALVVNVAVTDGLGQAARVVGPAAALALATWMLFWRPRVEVSDGGIDVRNVLRSTHVPWPAYRGAEPRWSLEVRTTGAVVTAWAAPRSGAAAARRRRKRPDDVAPSGATAEAVAAAIEERHAALTAAGYLDGADRTDAPTARTTWNVVPIAAFVGLVAASAVALAV